MDDHQILFECLQKSLFIRQMNEASAFHVCEIFELIAKKQIEHLK